VSQHDRAVFLVFTRISRTDSDRLITAVTPFLNQHGATTIDFFVFAADGQGSMIASFCSQATIDRNV